MIFAKNEWYLDFKSRRRTKFNTRPIVVWAVVGTFKVEQALLLHNLGALKLDPAQLLYSNITTPVFDIKGVGNLTEQLLGSWTANCSREEHFSLCMEKKLNGTSLSDLLLTTAQAPYSKHVISATDIGTHLISMLRNEDPSDVVDSSRVDFVAHVYVMPCLLLVGFINQALNICTLNSLASAGYLYLKASAIADVISIIALIPFCIRQGKAHNTHSYMAMFFHAHVELPLINSLITASALCLVAMSLDRYLSIQNPITFYNTPDAKSRIRTSIVVLYILSFVVFIPSAWQKVLIPHWDPGKQDVYWSINRNRELNQSNPFKIYLMFRELVARIGPILVLTVLNIGMIRSLRRIKIRYNSRRMASNASARVREMDRSRISVLLFITSATFIVCTLPASMLSFFVDHLHDTFEMQMFRAFANCLQVSHYLHNFYLYALCSSEYRHAFLKLIGCYKPRRPFQSTNDSPTIRFSTTVLGRVCSLRFDRLTRYTGRKKVPTTQAPISAAI
ncbi:putative G-protein coupled receptor AH9.1 [Aphelenchoides besseyi]|nr:putative G-protein coupled receptor AH9.1 [Aphelenchoides besseyi]KAI6210207.1 putative G-protein coupled receptor AH9.1 [Aphelenchoides besseyi]